MKVYYLNSYGKSRVIGEATLKEEVNLIINNFLNKNHYKSYYTRTFYVPDENRTYYDVGSHTEFFYVKGNIMDNNHLIDLTVYD